MDAGRADFPRRTREWIREHPRGSVLRGRTPVVKQDAERNLTIPPPAVSAPLAERAVFLRCRLDAFREKLAGCAPAQDAPAFLAAMEEFLESIHVYEDKEAYAAFEKSAHLEEFRAFFAPCVPASLVSDLRAAGEDTAGPIRGSNGGGTTDRADAPR